jgi:hypothetical protein
MQPTMVRCRTDRDSSVLSNRDKVGAQLECSLFPTSNNALLRRPNTTEIAASLGVPEVGGANIADFTLNVYRAT